MTHDNTNLETIIPKMTLEDESDKYKKYLSEHPTIGGIVTDRKEEINGVLYRIESTYDIDGLVRKTLTRVYVVKGYINVGLTSSGPTLKPVTDPEIKKEITIY